MLFCCGREGTASLDPDVPGTDLVPLFDTLLSTIRPPEGDPEAPFQMLVSSVDYNEFVGRIGIGRIQNGDVYKRQVLEGACVPKYQQRWLSPSRHRCV